MKQEAIDGIAPFLPQEIIKNILKFLPVKSLIRFQIVCKHWKNLIKSPSFIAAHLHHSTQHTPCLLFHRYNIRNRLQLYLIDFQLQIVEVQNTPIVEVRNTPVVDRGTAEITGSCNGLLCLRIERRHYGLSTPPSLLLWNPSFRDIRQVPNDLPIYDGKYYIGFGFSPIVNDYKIVRVYVSNYNGKVHLVEVYSLATGSWKNIEVGILESFALTHYEGFALNGAIYWFGWKKDMEEGVKFVMVSFDIAKEVFEWIPGPDINFGYGVHVTEFENKIAMLYSSPIRNSVSCLIELGVLDEGMGGSGERWSWTKKYTSGPHAGVLCPMAFWRNEIACVFCPPPAADSGKKHAERKTVLANFTNTELNVLFDQGHFVFNYVESLIPVSNMHVEES